MPRPHFIAHIHTDSVAVAAQDVSPGPAGVAFLDETESREITAQASIVVGHKVALIDVAEGAEVIEYGEPIGVATTAIFTGDHVHVHNVRSGRWHQGT